MNVLFVNTMDLPGRRFNGYDLLTDLAPRGIKSKQAVLYKQSENPSVVRLLENPMDEHLQAVLTQIEGQRSMGNLLFPWGRVLARSPEFLEADVVHYHLIHPGVISLLDLPMLFKAKPSVWTFHDPWPLTGHCIHPRECDGWLSDCRQCPALDAPLPMAADCADRMHRIKRRVLRSSKFDIVVASEFMLDMVTRSPVTSNASGIRVHLIPFGLDTVPYLSNDQKQASRESLGIPAGDFVVLFRASDSGLKGLDYIIESLKGGIAARPTTILTVDQRHLVDDLSDRFTIKEYGWVDDRTEYASLLCASDVLLMPSPAESFGLMALEAMASGRPVVCFAGTALEKITRSPECGWAVPYGDAQALSAALEALASNPDDARRRGELGRRIVKDEHGYDEYLSALARLYQVVVSSHDPAAPDCAHP